MASMLDRLAAATTPPPAVSPERSAAIAREISTSNRRPFRIFSATAASLSAAAILVQILPALLAQEPSPPRLRWTALGLRCIAAALGAAGFIGAPRLASSGYRASIRASGAALPALGALTLSTLSAASALEGLGGCAIDAAAVAAVAFAALVAVPPALGAAVQAAPFAAALATRGAIGGDAQGLIAVSLNGALIFAAGALVSAFSWNSRYSACAARTLLEEAEARVDFLSLHDGLTGLPNRRRMEMRIEEEIAAMRRYGWTSSIAVADVDGFSALNDRLGRQAGDEALKRVADLLSRSMRGSDMAARWGGGQFLLFFTHCDDVAAAKASARIKALVEDVGFESGGERADLTLSFGVAPLRGEGEEAFQAAFERAEVALRRAKDLGRNRVEVWIP